jgi:pimeloyl-ACP methyl ester carboxylesterase
MNYNSSRYRHFSTFVALAVALAMELLLFGAMPAKATSPYGSCQTLSRNVALGPNGPANQIIVGELCLPNSWATGPHNIDIMVHGATYNRHYWHWPQDPNIYSQVDKTLQAGRATFIYDRLGSGDSSHPLSTSLSVTTEAYSLHQIIQWLRHDYPQITVIGHSVGSIVAVREAGTYNDANRLVVTGLAHLPIAAGTSLPGLMISVLYSAKFDRQFEDAHFDEGYLTTMPGTRGASFYNTQTADPNVIDYDEAHKDVLSFNVLNTAFLDFGTLPLLNVSSDITLPVLLVIGQEDGLYCGLLLDCTNDAAVFANEAPFYTAAANLNLETIPDTGHDLTLHPSAGQSHAVINDWILSHQ